MIRIPTSLWARSALASFAIGVAAVLTLAPYLTNAKELVRIRHALVLGENLESYPTWKPPQAPADFMHETRPPPELFRDVVRRLDLDRMPTDWDRVRAIARDLSSSHQPLTGGAIKSDLQSTYRRIVGRGEGYCGDFVRAFTAIAIAAGMEVRPWGFSFDGFGGHGHILVEVWNRQRDTWELVDIYNNYFFTEDSGRPLSAAQFREALARGSPALRLQPLFQGSPPGFVIESKAWDYFRAGLSQWYAVWGNNVYSAESAPLVRVAAPLGRVLEQLAAISLGDYPQVRILAVEENLRYRLAMVRLRQHLHLVMQIVAAAGAAFIVFSLLWLRARRRRAAETAPRAHGHGLQRTRWR